MDSTGSDTEERRALPARRAAVTKTYGKPKADKSSLLLQAEQSFTSDLTSLSQLSQAPPTTSEDDLSTLPFQNTKSRSSSENSSDGESGNGGCEDDSGFDVGDDIRAMLKKVDMEFDARPDSDFLEEPSVSAVVLSTDLTSAPAVTHQRIASGDSSSSVNVGGQDTGKHVLGSTSSPRSAAPERTSPPTSPSSHSIGPSATTTNTGNIEFAGGDLRSPQPFARKSIDIARRVLDSDDDEGNDKGDADDKKPVSSLASNATFKPSHRHRNRVIDSEDEDEDEDEAASAPKGREVESSDEDALPSLRKIAHAARKQIKSPGSDIEVDEAETQKTEEIENWNDSQVYQSNCRSETPNATVKKEKKVKPLSKKALEETYKESEKARRNRQASIMPRSRPARPLSEITQKLQGPDSGSRPLSSMRPGLPHRPRSSTVKPALSLRYGSVPASSAHPAATGSSNVIDIGSSSAIFDIDEDSYNTKFLQADSQSQSQDSLSTSDVSRTSIMEYKAAARDSKENVIDDNNEDDDDELPDVKVIFENNRKARALKEKKAKLLAMQLEKESAATLPKADVKGKGREMSLSDSDAEELEVVVPRASTPVIKAAHHTPRSHSIYRKLAPNSVKQEHDADIDDSQIRRAGRTFASGGDKVFVAPHVAMKSDRNKPTRKAPNAVNTININRHLLEKAQNQAHVDKLKRQEDWKRRGGTLRYDTTVHEDLVVGDGEEDQEGQTKELMEALRADAEQQSDGNDGADEDEDSDYKGSDEEEEAIYSGSEAGSMDGEEDLEDTKQRPHGPDVSKPVDSDVDGPDMDADLSSIATTQVIPSNPEDQPSDISEDDVVVTARRSRPVQKASSDDEEETVGQASPAGHAIVAVQPTQYHEFVVKGGTQTFPEAGPMRAISLTQAFGEAGATQAMPQGSRAAVDEADDFADMFGEDGVEGFTQTQAPTQTSKPSQPEHLPSMFRRGTSGSPQLQRHAFGEAPMLLDAALRDAQIREEAERAYDQIQLARAQTVTNEVDHDVTRTPGSTLSEELPPLAPVTIVADRYTDRGMSEEESVPFDLSDDESRSANSPTAPRRLRRAGSGSPVNDSAHNKQRNAFDLLREGQHKKADGLDKKKKKKHSDFIAEEVEESEDEGGMYSMLRKDDGDGDESGSDLDATVEELVDDEEGDAEEVEKQDELADEKHREYELEKDARTGKLIEKVIKGQMKRKGRGHGGDLSDSDYEDETMHREAKARKQRKYTDKMAALADNPETQSFARVAMEDGVAELLCDFLEGAEPTSEAASDNDEDWDMDMDEDDDLDLRRPGLHRRQKTYVRAGSEIEMAIIDNAIYGGIPSSPLYEPQDIQDNLLVIASRTTVTHRPGAEVFDDIDFSYEVHAEHGKRRNVQFEKDDSQNDRGLGPGKNSAVTSFVKKGHAQSGTRSTTGHVSNRTKNQKSSSISHAKSLSSRHAGQNVGGRLAAFRQGKK